MVIFDVPEKCIDLSFIFLTNVLDSDVVSDNVAFPPKKKTFFFIVSYRSFITASNQFGSSSFARREKKYIKC